MGRPAAAWALNAAYALCRGSVGRLVYLRLAALIGIILLALTSTGPCAGPARAKKAALAVAACVALSPACGVYAAWGGRVSFPLLLILCLLAGSLLQRRGDDPLKRRLRMAAAASFLLLACTLWQAAVPMALLAGFADLWRRFVRGESLRAALKTGGQLSSWMIVAATALTYLLGHRLLVFAGWVHGAGLDRMALATDWHSKTRLFLDLLRSGFASWGRLHSLWWELPVAGWTLTAAGAAILGGGFPKELAGGRCSRRACSWRASRRSWVAHENNASYRSLPVLYAVVAFLAVEGVARWRWRVSARAGTVGLGGLTLLLGLSAAYHVRAGLVQRMPVNTAR